MFMAYSELSLVDIVREVRYLDYDTNRVPIWSGVLWSSAWHIRDFAFLFSKQHLVLRSHFKPLFPAR